MFLVSWIKTGTGFMAGKGVTCERKHAVTMGKRQNSHCYGKNTLLWKQTLVRRDILQRQEKNWRQYVKRYIAYEEILRCYRNCLGATGFIVTMTISTLLRYDERGFSTFFTKRIKHSRISVKCWLFSDKLKQHWRIKIETRYDFSASFSFNFSVWTFRHIS